MRKLILKWLFGADWEEYWDLHEKYIFELGQHKKSIEREKELIEETQELRERILKEIEDNIKISKMSLKILDAYEKLERICKENGIDTEEV